MKTVTTAQQLGKAVKAGQYPIRVVESRPDYLVSGINKIRKPSRFVWGGAIGSIGAVLLVFGGTGGAAAFMFGVPMATVAAAGGGVALAVLGFDTLKTAVLIAKAGVGIDVLNEIRKHKWEADDSETEGILS